MPLVLLVPYEHNMENEIFVQIFILLLIFVVGLWYNEADKF